MALKSFKVTKQEIRNYYSPRVSRFQSMINSIASPMGFGQYIENYSGQDVLNTYYHVWDDRLNTQVVIDNTSLAVYPISQAGPELWGVSSDVGISFLNGTLGINGYRKLKYCNNCSDANTPIYESVSTFKKSFSQVISLVDLYDTLDGYLFYDYSLPRFSNIFPSVKVDNGVNQTFYFKTLNGEDKTLSDISQETGKPIIDIETSIDEAEIVKPQDGNNSLILSCCDKTTYYIADGQLKIGATITTQGLSESPCWYVESYTNDEPNTPRGFTFVYGERSCETCVRNNPCGGAPTSSVITDCCGNRLTYIIDGVYSIGTILYTKDVSPALCFQVKENTSSSPDNFYRYNPYMGTCKDCINSYPCGKG